ncbi:ABC transporter permease [Microbacterium sp.]|uniref:ABC transporter permease n=1 Tax=Microbacterium sp. TaxID=51671 RepID=UPI003A8E2FDD
MAESTTGVTRSLTTPPPAPNVSAKFRGGLVQWPVLQIVLLIALALWLVISIPAILRPNSLKSVLIIAALLALASLGQTLVVILGGLDLGIPGYILFGAFAAANLTDPAKVGWPLAVALLVMIAVCGGIGAFVGWASHRYRIQPLVLTLGVSAMLSGTTLFFSGADISSVPPLELRALTQVQSTTLGIPTPPIVVIVIALGIVLWLFLSRTAAGRRLYATGVNPRAAGLTLVNTSRIWTLVFALSGVFAGFAGVFIASFHSGWSQTDGDPYLYSGLAAVIVGGTTFGSIRGSFTRTIIGALILTALSTIIVSNGLAEAQSRIIYGAVILVVVALYSRDRHVRDRF